MTSAKFTTRGKTTVGGLKVYTVSKGLSRPRMRPRPRPRPRRPRPRPIRRVWNYRRIGTYRIAKSVSIRGRRYLGTVKQRVNPVKQCALMAREKRYLYFGLRSRRYCYGARSRRPLTKYGRSSGFRGMVVYKIGRGSLRPKPRASPWYYQFIGRFKSLTTRSLGRFVGRMKGRNKVFKCARRARNMGYKAFALRNRGDCYVSKYSRTYSGKVRMYGRFKASSGGLRSIDAYNIRKGRYKPRPRPRKGGSVWHYRWIGRFRSPKGRGLGKRLGRVTGRRKIFSCALLARRKRYRAFALRRSGVCYGTFSSRTYTRKPVIKGRFRASAGGFNFIDAYTIGKGPYTRPKPRTGSGTRSRKGRGRKLREKRRKARRKRRKRARIAKTRKLKRRLKRRLLKLRLLKRKQVLVTRRVRRLKVLGKIRRLIVVRKVRIVLRKRILKMKTRIRVRKLRLKRRYYRLQAAKRRARMLRARRRAIRILRIRARRHVRRLRLLASKRLVRARKISRLRRLRRYRMLAKLRARQQAERRRMVALARKRIKLLRRKILLRQRAIRARYRRLHQRAARLRTLQFRIKARQRRMGMRLIMIRRGLVSISQKMSYYRRLRRYAILRRLQTLRRYQIRKAASIRVRWSRYQRQLISVKRRRRLMAIRKQRVGKRMWQYQRKRWEWLRKQRKKLKRLLLKRIRKMRAGKKRGDILSHKSPTETSVHETYKKRNGAVIKHLKSADYLWQFEDFSSGESHDALHKTVARFMGGARVVSTIARGHVATTSDKKGWISLGDFQGKCFSDPDQCKHKGMTVMASLKLDKTKFHNKSSSYFLSSGGQTTEARGFAFLHLLNRYIITLSTHHKQWQVETTNIPRGWFNMAFTWKKDGLLKLYVNGKEIASGKSFKVSRPNDAFSHLEIGRPNNSDAPTFRVPLEIDNLALWERVLASDKIKALAKRDQAKTNKKEEKKI